MGYAPVKDLVRQRPESSPVSSSRFSIADSPALDAFESLASSAQLSVRRFDDVQARAAAILESPVTSFPSVEVLQAADRLQVDRIHAMSNPTQMVKINILVNESFLSDVESSMSETGSEKFFAQLPVTISINGSDPEPATLSINFIPGPVVNPGTCSSSSDLQPAIMLGAHTAP